MSSHGLYPSIKAQRPNKSTRIIHVQPTLNRSSVRPPFPCLPLGQFPDILFSCVERGARYFAAAVSEGIRVALEFAFFWFPSFEFSVAWVDVFFLIPVLSSLYTICTYYFCVCFTWVALYIAVPTPPPVILPPVGFRRR